MDHKGFQFNQASLVGRLFQAAMLFGLVATAASASAQIILPPVGDIYGIAGDGTFGYSGDGGTATSAELNHANGIATDRLGNVYIADAANNRIREVNAGTGKISTVAGDGTGGFSGDGARATLAELDYPTGVAVDNNGNIYIADQGNNRIREVTASTGKISTVAGGGSGCLGEADSVGDGCSPTSAILNGPEGIAVDASDDIYIADTSNDAIREVSAGTISTVAGDDTLTCEYDGDGGLATAAGLCNPIGVAVDTSGDLFIADTDNDVIREVMGGYISTVAGYPFGAGPGCPRNPEYTGTPCLATNANFNEPSGVAVDIVGNIYIADYGHDHVFEVTAVDGNIWSFAGDSSYGFTSNGTATSESLWAPFGVAAAGNVYIGESEADQVTAVAPLAPEGSSTWTVVGSAGFSATAASNGQLGTTPLAFVFAPDGTPYVAYVTSGQAVQVMEFNGSSWVDVGGAFDTADDVSFAFASDGTPYVADASFGNNDWMDVWKYNGSSWVSICSACEGVGDSENSLSLAIASTGTPYAAFSESNLSIVDYNGSSWASVGATVSDYPYSDNTFLVFGPSGEPYVAYDDGSHSGKATVIDYNGSSWAAVGSAGFSAGTVQNGIALAFAPGFTAPYVAYVDGAPNSGNGNGSKATVMQYDGSSWIPLEAPGFSAGTIKSPSLAFDSSDNAYVAYQDSALGGKAIVMEYNPAFLNMICDCYTSVWIPLGSAAGFTAGAAQSPSIAISPSGTPYVAFVDGANGNKLTVMSY